MDRSDALEGAWQEPNLSAFMASAPDAIVIVDQKGTVRYANAAAGPLFAAEAGSLVGQTVENLLPERLRQRHVEHRRDYLAHPRPRPMGAALDLVARRGDGTEIPVDVTLNAFASQGELFTIAFVRDATERKQAERAATQLHEAEQRRLQALEINDNVVQGLAAALMTLEAGDHESTAKLLTEILGTARARIDELLRESGRPEVEPGELVRQEPARTHGIDLPAAAQAPRGPSPVRVLIADDAADLRLVMRVNIEADPDMVVVGEAANGADAVARAEELHPDVVLLDLAMPVMDGLQALPELRRRVPDARVVVLSGFGGKGVKTQVLGLGAFACIEKGARVQDLLALISAAADDRTSAATTDQGRAGRRR